MAERLFKKMSQFIVSIGTLNHRTKSTKCILFDSLCIVQKVHLYNTKHEGDWIATSHLVVGGIFINGEMVAK